MLLRFELTGQFINRIDTEKPVAKSTGYLYAEFIPVSDEWKNQIITALFTKGDKSYTMLLTEENKCLVPWEVLTEEGDIYVSCFCGELITVNKSRVTIFDTGYVEDTENGQEPTPNIYDQLIEQFQELREETRETLEEYEHEVDGGLFTDWDTEGDE